MSRLRKTEGGEILYEREELPKEFLDKEYVVLIDEGEPESFEEAKRDTHIHKWMSSMRGN